MQVETKSSEHVDAIELHLLNEWHLRNARERRVERERRQRPARRWQPSEPQCWFASAALMALSAVVLAVWG